MALSWEEHKKQYEQLAREKGVTIAEYAKAYELNANTARRYLRKPSGDNPISVEVGKDATKKGATKSQKGKGGKTGGDTSPGKRGASNDRRHQNSGLIIEHENKYTPPPPPPKGNERRVKTGKYTAPRNIDLNEAKSILANGNVPSDYLVMRLLAHLNVLERAREKAIAYYEEYEADEDETDPAVKLTGLLLSTAPAISDLTRTIAQIQQGSSKEIRDQQKHDEKRSEPEIVKEAYALRKKHDWTATETAEYIEANGAKIPTFLAKMVDHELKQPPANNDDGPASIEDLDQQAREARLIREEIQEQELEEKRQQITQIVDSGGFGDVDRDGVVSGFELAEFDDDEEPDEELNRQLYGDDDE